MLGCNQTSWGVGFAMVEMRLTSVGWGMQVWCVRVCCVGAIY